CSIRKTPFAKINHQAAGNLAAGVLPRPIVLTIGCYSVRPISITYEEIAIRQHRKSIGVIRGGANNENPSSNRSPKQIHFEDLRGLRVITCQGVKHGCCVLCME